MEKLNGNSTKFVITRFDFHSCLIGLAMFTMTTRSQDRRAASYTREPIRLRKTSWPQMMFVCDRGLQIPTWLFEKIRKDLNPGWARCVVTVCWYLVYYISCQIGPIHDPCVHTMCPAVKVSIRSGKPVNGRGPCWWPGTVTRWCHGIWWLDWIASAVHLIFNDYFLGHECHDHRWSYHDMGCYIWYIVRVINGILGPSDYFVSCKKWKPFKPAWIHWALFQLFFLSFGNKARSWDTGKRSG